LVSGKAEPVGEARAKLVPFFKEHLAKSHATIKMLRRPSLSERLHA